MVMCMVDVDHAEACGAEAAVKKAKGEDAPYVFNIPELVEAEDMGFAEADAFIETMKWRRRIDV